MLIETGPLFKLYYRSLVHICHHITIDATKQQTCKRQQQNTFRVAQNYKNVTTERKYQEAAHVQRFSKNHSQVLGVHKNFNEFQIIGHAFSLKLT